MSLTASQLDLFTTLVADAGTVGRLRLTAGGVAGVGVAASLADLEVAGSNQADTLSFVAGATTAIEIEGVDGADTLTGGAGDDNLAGGRDADLIQGGAGDDTLDGGSGTSSPFPPFFFEPADRLSYAAAAGGITIALAFALPQNTGGAGTDTISNFENAVGSAFADTITGTAGINRLTGAAGNDTLNGGANDTLAGGDGNDTLNGGTGSDTATYAGAGVAVTVAVIAGQRNTGGAGLDTLISIENFTGSAFADQLAGDAGANVLNGQDGDDTLVGGGGDDTLFGGNGDDVLTAGSGFDILNGGAGDDDLNGGGLDTVSHSGATGYLEVSLAVLTPQDTQNAGTDTLSGFVNLIGSSFSDTITGSTAANEIRLGAGVDFAQGDDGDDSLFGDTGNDTLWGNDGDDLLEGGSGNDQLRGDAGDDFLEGGTGNDTLQGLSGLNIFSFRPGGGSDTADWTNGSDILRFEGFGTDYETAAEIIATAAQVGTTVQLTLDNPVGLGVTTVTLGGQFGGTFLGQLTAGDFIAIA